MTHETSGVASVLAMPRSLSWTMAMLFLLGSSVDQAYAKGSFQNGHLNGAVYAGAVDYSSEDLFITGITYATNGDDHAKEAQCFVSKMPSDGIGLHHEILATAIGDGYSMQACHTLSVLHDPGDPGVGSIRPFVVAGTSGPEAGFGTTDSPSGFLVTFKQDHEDAFPIKNSINTDEAAETNRVSYPISTKYVWGQDTDGTGDRFDDAWDRVTYIASITSTEMNENAENAQLMTGTSDQPNWMKYYKFGTQFDLLLQKFTLKKGTNEEELSYSKIYPLDEDPDTTVAQRHAFVGGMILKRRSKKDFLIVTGSTSGTGEVYGNAVPGSQDIDGFIAVFSGHTGELRNLPANQPDFQNNIRPGTAETDLILGACDDPYDPDHFYIVGSTGSPTGMGDPITEDQAVLFSEPGSLNGFVQKIELNTLQKVWGKTWSANYGPGKVEQSVTAGYGCRVIKDGSLYVTGIVEKGAHVKRDVQNDHSFDDIVAMRLTTDGDVKWLKQFGSADGNDGLGRSEPIAVDSEDNMIILGDTTGSMFRKREDVTDKSSDMFVVTLSKSDGSHDEIVPPKHVGDFIHESSFDKEIAKDDLINSEKPKTGMFSGGQWKDYEVYGNNDWVDKQAIGIQSGPTSGSVYAGGMVYDGNEDGIYVTGIAYAKRGDIEPSCMVTKLRLNDDRYNSWSNAIGRSIGSDNALEVCNSVALHGYGEVVAVGSAANGSPLHAGNSSPMTGFALALDRFDLREVDEIHFITEDPMNRVSYPENIVSDGDDIYVVFAKSIDAQNSKESDKVTEDAGQGGSSPNWTNMKKHGSSFDMTVAKVSLKEETIDGVAVGDVSFSKQWSKEFPMTPAPDGTIPRVFIGGAILKKRLGYLAVAGSTRGMGEGYGAAVGDDEDGFVTLLDMNTGELATNVIKNNIREGTAEDDIVTGICHDPDDDTSFYIVGGTKGELLDAVGTTMMIEGSTHAFLLKIDAESLETIWAVQLGAQKHGFAKEPTTAHAYDCVVSGDTVYAGGIVDDGAGMVKDAMTRSSRGGDDIWLASFDIEDGGINWLRQMGSDGDDHLSRRGGLAINNEGNILVFGDTNGNYFRDHSEDAEKLHELFLMEVNKDGSHKPHLEHDVYYNDPAPAPAPVPAPSPGSPQTTPPPFLISPEKKGISKGLVITLSVVGGLIALILVIVLVRCCLKRQKPTAKVQVRDGILTDDKGKSLSKTPPPSSFRSHKKSGKNDDSANLNVAANDII